ncbi:hypothetical protein H696_05118 [Fonticula alba]|uniref:NTF2 domain-containing protein n=1 Tax=Fonticula alba TaxID=691883 RepID=A0A058Z1M8_FONAL|nr:hypothetical protein H696_05118 [Fonticula alba]KCV68189.1 hypothetical protein H696_05118 [Fonticula alba]|eukprot:XP_009497243.1 hypothetical protein H696_05118 [Fonticula alba]
MQSTTRERKSYSLQMASAQLAKRRRATNRNRGGPERKDNRNPNRPTVRTDPSQRRLRIEGLGEINISEARDFLRTRQRTAEIVTFEQDHLGVDISLKDPEHYSRCLKLSQTCFNGRTAIVKTIYTLPLSHILILSRILVEACLSKDEGSDDGTNKVDLRGLVSHPAIVENDIKVDFSDSLFVTALAKIINRQFPDAQTLLMDNNNIKNLRQFNILSQFVPNTINLSLSGNLIGSLDELGHLKSFKSLKNLLCFNNPIAVEPPSNDAVLDEIPHLQTFNGLPLESFSIAGAAVTGTSFKFPENSNFIPEDNRKFVNDFLTNYFSTYDNNRLELGTFYSAEACASISGVPPSHCQADGNFVSRNLLMTSNSSHSKSRFDRNVDLMVIGREAIIRTWFGRPKTEHDLFSFRVDVTPLDSSLFINIHGDVADISDKGNKGSARKVRYSFDRVFILQSLPDGIKIVNDMLSLRNLSGRFTKAMNETNIDNARKVARLLDESFEWSLEFCRKYVANALDCAQILLEFRNTTNLRTDFAADCLERSQWDVKNAMALFEQHRPSMLPEHFRM